MADIALPYFVSLPEAAPPWPGIVVIHEGNGMSPQLLRVCQRLAAEGYGVVAPDLFWRFGGPDPDNFWEHVRSIEPDDVRADLKQAVAKLRGLGATKIGVTGFCMGGRFTYLAAVSPDVDIAAAAPFYGGGIAAALGEPTCPLLAFFGDQDEWVPMSDVEKVQAAHPGQVVVYAGAGHGFLRDGSDDYHEEAATDAWKRLLDFFGEHLSP